MAVLGVSGSQKGNALGYKGFNKNVFVTPWQKFEGGDLLVCQHMKLSGKGNWEHFQADALLLPGVYLDCPEHAKRRLLVDHEKALATQSARAVNR